MRPAHKLKVINLFNMNSGRHILADHYLNQGVRETERLRHHLTRVYRKNRKYLVCQYCHGNVYLRGGFGKEHQLHFVHFQSKKFDKCPLNEHNSQKNETEIRAIKYNGVPESKRHFNLKHLIGKILNLDKDCSRVIVDKLFRGRDLHERRKPDVQCIYKGKKFVFELQLSTEFITIIQEREEYYRSKGAYLIWIFDSFTKDTVMNLSQKDIYYINSNAYCLDDESIKASFANNKLNFLAVYDIPKIEGTEIISHRHDKRINLDNLTCDNTFNTYYYNYNKSYYEYKYEVIYKKLIAFINNDEEKYLNKVVTNYLRRISEISLDFKFDVYNFVLYMLTAKYGRDILDRGISKYKFICNLFLNPLGNGTLLFYFYSVLKNNDKDFPDMRTQQKAKDIFKEFHTGNAEIRLRFTPKKDQEELFSFLFPNEYKKFLELVQWAGLSWNAVDVSRFEHLDYY